MRRPGDFAARYGGEEFVVILEVTGQTAARELAERIRAGVLREAIEHCGSAASKVLSISIGVVAFDPAAGERSAQGLVQRADEALYLAKEHGRNCVVDAEQSVSPTATGTFSLGKRAEPAVVVPMVRR
jgi:diguanylate cyclase (GGDEF)-like protein